MPGNFRLSDKQLVTLKIAVNTFNKNITKLEKAERDNKKLLYLLPDKIDNFKDLYNNITTIEQYNRVVKSLRSIKNKKQQELIQVGQEQILRWQANELTQDIYNYINRLHQEYQELQTPYKNRKYSRLQMGSTENRRIERQLQEVTEFYNKSGYEYKQFIDKMHKVGVNDYVNKKAITYRENYMNVLNRFKNLDNYEELMNILRTKNAYEFYELMKDSDLTVDLTYVSDTTMTQDKFNEIFEDIIEGEYE